MIRKIVFAGAAAFALLAVPAAAQRTDARPSAQPLTRAAFEAATQARFARADVNRDGFITREEMQVRAGARRNARVAERGQRRAERFARLDTNRDGSISRAEFDARAGRAGDRAGRGADRAERRADRIERRSARRGNRGMGQGIARLDTNRDSRISLAEVTAARLARFERMDSNGDGLLTREERRAARQSARQARQTRTNG